MAFDILVINSLTFTKNFSNPGLSIGAHDSTFPYDRHYVSDPFLSLSRIDDLLPWTGSSYDAATPSRGDLLPAYWPGDIEADQNSSSKAIEMTTCAVCTLV